MRLIEKKIEWLVAMAVMLITTFGMLNSLMDSFEMTVLNSITNYVRLLIILLVFLFQLKRFGLRVYDKRFMAFYLIFCLYILLDTTLLRRLPLEELLHAPVTVVAFLFRFVSSILYLLSAKTIVQYFSVRKFLILSVIFCTIPSILLVQYVGVELIQMGLDEDDEGYISTLSISYSNVPLAVMSIIFYKNLVKTKFFSVVFCSAILIASIYVLLVYGKRGPLLWMGINILACYFMRSRKVSRYIIALSLLSLLLVIFMDPIVEAIKDVLPTTGERIENSIKEGDTDGRFDLDKAYGSTYLIGLENFTRSPIWGNYFRLETSYIHFRGAYPHNIFIEILMTMGLLGFIPFMGLLVKAFIKCRNLFTKEYTQNQMACLILFLCPFLQTQTSETIVFKFDLWLFFYILCCLDKLCQQPSRNSISRKSLRSSQIRPQASI